MSEERSTSGSITLKVVLKIVSIVVQSGTDLGANLVYQVNADLDKDEPKARSLRFSSFPYGPHSL